MPATTTPRKVSRIASRVLMACAPATVLITAGWGFRLWEGRPHLTMMLFCIALGAAMVSAIVWSLSVCHLAIAKAFSVGVELGRAQAAPPVPEHAQVPDLRVVE